MLNVIMPSVVMMSVVVTIISASTGIEYFHKAANFQGITATYPRLGVYFKNCNLKIHSSSLGQQLSKVHL